jgi:hypothetical protein
MVLRLEIVSSRCVIRINTVCLLAAKGKNQKQQHADPFDVHRTWEEVHGQTS